MQKEETTRFYFEETYQHLRVKPVHSTCANTSCKLTKMIKLYTQPVSSRMIQDIKSYLHHSGKNHCYFVHPHYVVVAITRCRHDHLFGDSLVKTLKIKQTTLKQNGCHYKLRSLERIPLAREVSEALKCMTHQGHKFIGWEPCTLTQLQITGDEHTDWNGRHNTTQAPKEMLRDKDKEP